MSVRRWCGVPVREQPGQARARLACDWTWLPGSRVRNWWSPRIRL